MIKIFNDGTSTAPKIWTCRIVLEGDRYGRDNCLVHEGEPMIEFYDCRFEFTEYGQFVSRYYVSTLLENEGRHSEGYGLSLADDVAAWEISYETYMRVLKWLKSEFSHNEEAPNVHA